MVNVKIEITGTTDGFEHYYGKIMYDKITLFNWAFKPARTFGMYLLRPAETSSLLKSFSANDYNLFLRKLKSYLNTQEFDFDYIETKGRLQQLIREKNIKNNS